ncbi:Kinesin-1 [Striga hermonthica]|uniref:Kinesin-like protein n=1 Tax=Striga hermonthica TaxID=68872 RepID=A0A9N7MW03_STRHE|nr:Kinesin-1 [Striga hermonthica]
MATINQNKPPSSPSQNKYIVDKVPVERRRKMPLNTGIRVRKAFSVVNGGQDLPPISGPPSSSGSECGVNEFTKEEVEALLNEKLKVKNKFNYKEKSEQMAECIKKLKQCIKWFQQLEGNYVTEQGKLKDLLEVAEKRSNDMESLMKAKQDELNSIIMELRRKLEDLQGNFANEERDKLEALDSLANEKDNRLAAEKLQASISAELKRVQEDNATGVQKIQTLNDMYKRLQEYNTSLQQYNSRLQSELQATNETLKRVEKEKAAVVENLSTLRGHYTSLQEQLTSSRALQDEAMKQKEALGSEVTSLRCDLQQVRDDRDRQLLQVQALLTEVAKYKECTGKSIAELDNLTTKTTDLESTCLSQSEQIRRLQEQLAFSEKKLKLSDMSALEVRSEFEEQKTIIFELQNRLADAESKIVEGEKLRKKLHNTILELKGNIRVFCRVRPLLSDDGVRNDAKVVSFPTSTETLGRGIDLAHNGQKLSFTFDKVFMPDASQEDVFVEISQLVQSALDGYKVCIFAYGQTGSGKTHTMMGKPGLPDQKGIIPRSLEQVFETRKILQAQGWKYDMQVSMLEIYNETIRDLLAPNRTCSDASGAENAGKQYAIKHDANGNTHVSDLTVVDVRNSKEVSYLLERAAQSRSVGKTQMNEQSSRSHFVFTLRIMGFNENTDQQVQGVLNLIDLAGSERLSKSGSTGDRLKETQAINKSLSSLSDVIFALAKKEEHVPYRNSKLTYLLQPCLGGDSKTLMFVNVSPDPSSEARNPIHHLLPHNNLSPPHFQLPTRRRRPTTAAVHPCPAELPRHLHGPAPAAPSRHGASSSLSRASLATTAYASLEQLTNSEPRRAAALPVESAFKHAGSSSSPEKARPRRASLVAVQQARRRHLQQLCPPATHFPANQSNRSHVLSSSLRRRVDSRRNRADEHALPQTRP